jgi:hypothetical protein
MSYFNHAFCKTFVATKPSQAAQNVGTPGTGNQAEITDGILTSTGVGVWSLKEGKVNDGFNLGPGVVGFFDSKTNLSIDLTGEIECCPFYLAAASLKQNDKQGPFHGGYQESHKSKVINPKYLRKAWKVDPNAASRAVLEVGDVQDTGGACNKEFICEETYYLRVEVKGTAALRFANHNLYQTVDAYTGCCDDPLSPTAVDPAIVYVAWAKQIAEDPYLKDFIRPLVVVDGDSYGYDATVIAEEGLNAGNDFDAALAAGGTTAGLILLGAYADTEFEDCTFQTSDYYGKEPVQLYASEVDLNGDPCAFEGVCVTTECEGVQANGLGESVLRDVIKSESYLQNFMHSDLRIREITQGTSTYDIIDRQALYGRFFMLHSVPRFNNPTGVFDNDQYLLDIVGTADTNTYLEDAINNLIAACGACDDVEDYTVTPCAYTVPVVVGP